MAGKKPAKKVLGKKALKQTRGGGGVLIVAKAPRKNNEDKIASVTVEMYMENVDAKFA